MTKKARVFAVCSCEGTMAINESTIARGCKSPIATAHQLCQAELPKLAELLAGGEVVTIGCTQEAPTFQDAAAQMNFAGSLNFANIRENAGWSAEGAKAAPKMAALLAAAAVSMPPAPLLTLKSEGVILIYGRDEVAIEAGDALKDHLDVTVIINRSEGIEPRATDDFPVACGTIRQAKGHFGAFELVVDDFALPAPSSRKAYVFGQGRRGTSRADIVLDLSGGAPLFSADDLRQGYVRADPANPAAVAQAIFKVSHLVGEFDKPRYVRFTADLCAHSRSRKTGCTRCLDLCPTGAITPNGDHVAISAEICMGCGQCAAACPTGAAAYDFPPAQTLLMKLREALIAYHEAGGSIPVILFHDEDHGTALINALSRHGDGLPANVIPMAVNEITAIGLDALAGSFAYGARAVRILASDRPKHPLDGLDRTVSTMEAIAAGFGLGSGLTSIIAATDPDAVAEALRSPALASPIAPAAFLPLGSGRPLLKLALSELQVRSPNKAAAIQLPERAPFGGVRVNVEGCTLCLACVSACPTGALSDNPDRPMLRFSEELCVQCGLCQSTCPERVITLEPRLDMRAWQAPPIVVKEEEPFHCVACGKPFGVKSTIDRITAKLQGSHWMYSGANASRLRALQMCDDCRVEVMMNEAFDPHSPGERPLTRTSDDYFRARETKGDS